MGIELQWGRLVRKKKKKVGCEVSLLISRYNRPVFIHVDCESFPVLARLCNFPTPAVLASALCPSPLPPPLSHPFAPSHLPPLSPPCLSFQSGSCVLYRWLWWGRGAWGRDLAIVGISFFSGGWGGYLEDGARCYGVSAEIQSILLLKIKFCCLVLKRRQVGVLLGDVFGC